MHEDPEFRTSSSTDLDRWSEEIWPIDDRIADVLGLPPANAETMQGQRYTPASSSARIATISTRARNIGTRWSNMAASAPGPR